MRRLIAGNIRKSHVDLNTSMGKRNICQRIFSRGLEKQFETATMFSLSCVTGKFGISHFSSAIVIESCLSSDWLRLLMYAEIPDLPLSYIRPLINIFIITEPAE